MTKGLSRWVLVGCLVAGASCGAGDNEVDPGDLSLRDLLGVSPDVAAGWSAAQRLAARQVLGQALRAPPDERQTFALPPDSRGGRGGRVRADGAGGGALRGRVGGGALGERGDGGGVGRQDVSLGDDLDDRVADALVVLDAQRSTTEREPLAVIRAHVAFGDTVEIAPRPAADAAAALTSPAGSSVASSARRGAPGVELTLASAWDTSPTWSHLVDRGLPLLDMLAADTWSIDADPDAGGPSDPGRVVIVSAPQLSVIAVLVAHDGAPPHLAVNPVVLAAIDPAAAAPSAASPSRADALPRWSHLARPVPHGGGPPPGAAPIKVSTLPQGNPYSFYGSFEECAEVQREHCSVCLATGSCDLAPSDVDGNDECQSLSQDSGRGYFLLCINLSLAIGSVERCTTGKSSCTPVSDAADDVSRLDANAAFLTTPQCAGALDDCLGKIYGAPDTTFPGPGPGPDGGTAAEPPRSTNVTCGNACSDSNANCTFSPTANCGGSTSGNASSCGGGDCSCHDSDSSGGGCDNNMSSSTCQNDPIPSCNKTGSDSGSDGNCNTCDSGSGGSCNDCGGSDCSNGKCSVAPASPGPALALISLVWALLPVPIAARLRLRRRRASEPAVRPDIGEITLGGASSGAVTLADICEIKLDARDEESASAGHGTSAGADDELDARPGRTS